MSLWTRLLGIDGPKIPAHQFAGPLGDVIRQDLVPADLIAAFGLNNPQEQSDAQRLLDLMREPPEFYPLGGYTELTNVGLAFDAGGPAKGLGFLGIDVEGISEVGFKVRF